jgi:hypothetical protein
MHRATYERLKAEALELEARAINEIVGTTRLRLARKWPEWPEQDAPKDPVVADGLSLLAGAVEARIRAGKRYGRLSDGT